TVVAEQTAEAQRVMLRALSDRIQDERRDERIRLAAELHDEVIPPLYQLSLVGRVAEADVEAERYDELHSDMKALREAADAALSIARDAIVGLREDPLGPRGLAQALRSLAAELQILAECRIQTTIEDPPPMPHANSLIVYQIAREALANATRHAR